jgi:general secretion pathway protein G
MTVEVSYLDQMGLALRPTLAGRKSNHPGTQSARGVLRVLELRSPDRRVSRGFTLIEMMIVISIVMILTSIAVPIYRTHVLHAREAVLREDLFTMRQSIDQYTQDKVKAPQTLDDLVSSGYMRVIPKDPFTDSNQTWEPVMDDSIMQLGQTEPGIVDVHSGSKLTASDGTIYNTW